MSLLHLVDLTNSLSDSVCSSTQLGGITFIGVGACNPEHLTLAAMNAIAAANAIILDEDWYEEILDHEFLKQREKVPIATRAEDDIDTLIGAEVALAERGLLIVRLVKGDTLTNTQCNSEARECLNRGFFVELLPGLSEVTAVPVLAGVHLVPNETSQFVVLSDEEVSETHIPAVGTTFFTLAAQQIPTFVISAVRAGRNPSENCLVTFHGATTSQQSTLLPLNKLSNFVSRSLKAGMPSRLSLSLGVQGDVVSWYESQPFFGWRILLPRTKESDDDLIRRLARYGASITEVPTVAVEPPRNTSQMEKAISGIVDGRYAWVIFTSAHAVRAINDKLRTYGLDARAYSGLRVASVGGSTTRALEEFGITPDLMPEGQQDGQTLATEFPVFDALLDPINRVLIPRADVSTDTLAENLSDLGWEIDEVTVSRTVRANPPDAQVREAIKSGKFDAVFFTSSSSVRNLVGIAGKPPQQTVVAAIGPHTAAACAEHGLRVDALAAEPTSSSLLTALLEFAETRRNQLLADGEPVIPPSRRKRRRARSTT